MSIAKAIILCAGEGTRLRPLTSLCPKHLLPVAGQPLVGWVLNDLAAVGIREVGLVVGYHADAIMRYVGEGAQWDLGITYLTQEQPLGLAHAVNTAREFVGDQPFLVYLGDNVLEAGLAEFVNRFSESQADVSILVKEVDDPRQYGVVELEGEAVVRMVEKPAHPRSNLAIVGVYALNSVIFDAIDHIQPSARGEYEITDAIQWVLDNQGQVTAHKLDGFWGDVASPADLLSTNRFFLDRVALVVDGQINDNSQLYGQVGVGTDSWVIESNITGPVIIGNNSVIENCTIGPYVSVGDGCHVVDSGLRNCIVRDSCSVRGVQLADSVLGENVEIIEAGGSPDQPLSLVVGDLTRIRPT